MNKPLTLVYAGNRAIFDGILISLLSVSDNTDHPLQVFVLTMDLTDRNEKFLPLTEEQRAFLETVLKRKNTKSTVSLVDVGGLYREYLIDSPNTKTAYTPYSMIRLFLDRIDGIPEKVLYLDADTVAEGDISELFFTELDGAEFGAVLDHYGKIFMGYHYINSGVMLLDLARIKETGLFRKCIDALNKRRIFLPDQTALNRKVKKKKLLSRKFNEQKSFCEGTVIRHFTKTIIWHPFFPFFYTKNIKPWNTDGVRDMTNRYDSLLSKYEQLKGEYDNAIKKN